MHCIRGIAIGGDHGQRSLLRACATDNECPICGSLFASKYLCANHLVASGTRGHCTGAGSAFATLQCTKRSKCVICDFECDTPEALKHHNRVWHLSSIAKVDPALCADDLILGGSDSEWLRDGSQNHRMHLQHSRAIRCGTPQKEVNSCACSSAGRWCLPSALRSRRHTSCHRHRPCTLQRQRSDMES